MCDGPGGDFLYYAIRFFFTPENYARPTHPASEGLDDVIHQSLGDIKKVVMMIEDRYSCILFIPKGFQWIVSKISRGWMPRFLELKGRVLSRSDKDIFAKR